MHSVYPAPLQKGDFIGLVAPSSPLQPGRLEAGTRYLEQKGFKVKVGKHVNEADRFLAGPDAHRAQDIMDFFKDSEVKAILSMAGGNGSQRLLPLLDYEVIQKNPKVFVGFSDTTALQLGLLKKTGLVTYSGFTFRDAAQPVMNPLIEETLMACLMGKPYHVAEGAVSRPGIVQGTFIGGTLSLIIALMGTPYQPDFEGKILFFEQIWAEPNHIDSMLSQLDLAGVFDQVAGIVIGQFEQCVPKAGSEGNGTVEDVIQEWAARFRVPCLLNFPYGHGDRRCVLPIGGRVQLDVNATLLSVW